MGFFDFLKKKESKKGLIYAPTMGGNIPFYAPFGESIYASDIIVQSIRCKANEFKKLDPRHIKKNSDGTTSVINDSSLAKVLRRPNEFMTQADFLEKITILLELNKNCFIYPQFYVTNGGQKYFTGLYPLKPSSVNYLSDNSGKLYINMRFANGYETTLPANEIIHWRKDYGINDYFGGGMFGGDDNSGLLTMLKRYDEITQSIAKALEVSCSINGVMKINTYMDDEQRIAEREKFENEIKSNQSGILFTEMSTEYVNIPRDTKIVDAETLKFFYDTILRANGTSLAILNGDYTKAQKEAYYEHALEADIKSLGQAISKVVFSDREESFGNEIVLYPNDINFMSMENKIAFAAIAMPSGSLLKDEFRELFGYAPLPDGQGQVISQGYNNLLDADNNNNLQQGKEKEGGLNE
ncbi:phage portal protein [Solibacillus silvestris]